METEATVRQEQAMAEWKELLGRIPAAERPATIERWWTRGLITEDEKAELEAVGPTKADYMRESMAYQRDRTLEYAGQSGRTAVKYLREAADDLERLLNQAEAGDKVAKDYEYALRRIGSLGWWNQTRETMERQLREYDTFVSYLKGMDAAGYYDEVK